MLTGRRAGQVTPLWRGGGGVRQCGRTQWISGTCDLCMILSIVLMWPVLLLRFLWRRRAAGSGGIGKRPRRWVVDRLCAVCLLWLRSRTVRRRRRRLRDGIGQLRENWMWIGNDYVLDDGARDGAIRDGQHLLMLLLVRTQGWPLLLVVVVVVIDKRSTIDKQRAFLLHFCRFITTATTCITRLLRASTISPLNVVSRGALQRRQ